MSRSTAEVRLPGRDPLRPGGVWLWFVLAASLGAAGFLLFILNAGTPVPASWAAAGGARTGASEWFNALQQHLISPLIACGLGALILTRRPGHRIGRLMVALGLVSALGTLTQEWAVYGAYTVSTGLPGVGLAAWITNWIWVIIFGLLLTTAALFPDGRFLSRRWGWLISGLTFAFVFPALSASMIESSMSSAFQISNPLQIPGAAEYYAVVFNIGVVAMPLTMVAVLAAAVVRFRISQARERQQMKWLLAGVGLMAALTLAGLAISFGLASTLGDSMVNAAVLGPMLGVGVALLRHRLYDIDVLIRRTLVYGLLTGALALVYFGSVVLLQGGLRALTGQTSQLAIVLSTLAIAALFVPLRARIQELIDRRFYRRKYDAAQTLAAFSAAARDEVELDRLASQLVHVVDETMQPAQISVWLRPPGRPE